MSAYHGFLTATTVTTFGKALMKYWEIIADKLGENCWSWGYYSAVTQHGWRWVVDARVKVRRYIVASDELLSAFLALERVTRGI